MQSWLWNIRDIIIYTLINVCIKYLLYYLFICYNVLCERQEGHIGMTDDWRPLFITRQVFNPAALIFPNSCWQLYISVCDLGAVTHLKYTRHWENNSNVYTLEPDWLISWPMSLARHHRYTCIGICAVKYVLIWILNAWCSSNFTVSIGCFMFWQKSLAVKRMLSLFLSKVFYNHIWGTTHWAVAFNNGQTIFCGTIWCHQSGPLTLWIYVKKKKYW